jgi:glycosyltransferase AglD
MRERLDLSLILPCYNEVPVFPESIKWITRILDLAKITYEIILVDDVSRDQTSTLIKRYISTHKQIKAIYHTVNTGRGQAVMDGIKIARGTVVGYIDIDCEVSPVYIPEITQKILNHEADVIIGKRIYRTSFGSLFREILSIGYQKLSDLLIGTGGIDTESGYKFFNRGKILPVLPKTRDPHWFWDTEIMVFAKRMKLVILEQPVLFLRRSDKQSSVRVWHDILSYCTNLWSLHNRLQ